MFEKISQARSTFLRTIFCMHFNLLQNMSSAWWKLIETIGNTSQIFLEIREEEVDPHRSIHPYITHPLSIHPSINTKILAPQKVCPKELFESQRTFLGRRCKSERDLKVTPEGRPAGIFHLGGIKDMVQRHNTIDRY